MRFRSQISLVSVDRASEEGSSDGSATLTPLGDLSKWENVEFFRCKVVYGSSVKFGIKPFNLPNRLNWGAVLGISGAAVVSATIWAGVAWSVGLIWK